MTNQKFCFSYIRFSSAGQKDGSSVERQSPIAQRVANEKGWTLRTDLNAQDLGVSAFKGNNIKTLEGMIKAAKDGKIPAGSVMILEAVDRLTRTELDAAYDLFRDILKSGVEIYVDRGSRHFTKDSLKNPMDLLIAIMELHAANEYSSKLSQRVSAAYKSKSEKILKGEKVKINHLPSWINDDFTLNGKAKIVAGIVESYLNGKGPGKITQDLNISDVPTLTGRGTWSQAVVYRLLSNRQLIGEYEINGETIKGYFPSVVSEETFFKVQSKLNDNKGKHSMEVRDGEHVANIFSGIAYCSCGQKIKVTSGKNGRYLTCYGVVKGLGCKVGMSKYTPLEESFRTLLMFQIEQLISDDSGETVNSHIQILNGQLVEIKKQITTFETAVENAILNNDSNILKIAERKLTALRTEETETKKKLEIESARTVTVKGSDEKYKQLILSIKTGMTDTETRLKVQSWLRENVNRMDVDRTNKVFKMDFRNGGFLSVNFERNELLEIRKPSTVVSFKGEREYIAADVKTA